uniref:Arb2 domain-containing protein n=1 Tax=Micrurus surinamensis TaxID=129470 RepID=A0A2D4P7X8_MICSU
MNYNFVVSKTDLLSRIDLDELMKKDEPPLEFPDTLEGFEYTFNEKGQLRHIKTGEPFVFNYREDLHRWNQKRYEALGEIITKYVYELLEEECHLKKVYVPVDAEETEPRSFIFMSEDALINPDKLMILIQGNGVVRAGQWARRLIINEDLDSGTQIPYIKRAIEEFCRQD